MLNRGTGHHADAHRQDVGADHGVQVALPVITVEALIKNLDVVSCLDDLNRGVQQRQRHMPHIQAGKALARINHDDGTLHYSRLSRTDQCLNITIQYRHINHWKNAVYSDLEK